MLIINRLKTNADIYMNMLKTKVITPIAQSLQRISYHTRSVQKMRGLFELRGSSWFQKNPFGVARFVQIS